MNNRSSGVRTGTWRSTFRGRKRSTSTTSPTTSSAVRVYKTGVICKDDSKAYSFFTLWEVLQFSVLWTCLGIEKLSQLYGDDELFFITRKKQNFLWWLVKCRKMASMSENRSNFFAKDGLLKSLHVNYNSAISSLYFATWHISCWFLPRSEISCCLCRAAEDLLWLYR